MDELMTEKEVKQKTVATENVSDQQLPQAEEKTEEVFVKQAPPANAYVSTFENLTIADFKKSETQKKEKEKSSNQPEQKNFSEREEFQKKTDQDAQTENDEIKMEKDENEKFNAIVIEKPNFDLIETDKKLIKLKKNDAPKKQKRKKLAGLLLACALGGAAIVCVTNTVILDQMNSNFIQLEDSYKLKLGKYLRDISNLDATNKGMEMIETYPDDLLEAGDVGKKSNWFDRLCEFFGGIFGG